MTAMKKPGLARKTGPKPQLRLVREAAAKAPIPTKSRKAPVPTVCNRSATDKTTKQERVLTLLTRADGASIDEIMKATNWQQHSVRGFLAGTVKRKLGFILVSTKDNNKPRRYRIDKRRGV